MSSSDSTGNFCRTDESYRTGGPRRRTAGAGHPFRPVARSSIRFGSQVHQSTRYRLTQALLPVVLLCAWMVDGHAQTPTFPDSLRPQTIVANTERFASTHNASLELDYRVNDAAFNGLFRAWLLSSTTLVGERFTREQADLLADMQYDIDMPINPFFLFEGTMTGDVGELGLVPGIDNTAATFLGLGGRAGDPEGNHLGVAVGGAYNRQLNTEDAGAAIYFDGAGATDVGGYGVSLEGTGRWYNTSPRLNSNLAFSTSIDREYEEGVYFGAGGSWEHIANDLYIKRNEEDILLYGGVTYDGIRKRRERRFRVNALLLYPLGNNLQLDADLGVTTDGIARWESEEGLPPLPREPDPYRVDQRENSVGGSVGLTWSDASFQAGGGLSIRSSEQQNVVDPIGDVPEIELRRRRSTSALNDYRTNLMALDGSLRWNISRYDTIGLNGSMSIYRYDTPDTANNFDKDEGSITGGFSYSRRFSDLTSLYVEGQAYLTHLVYLFAENSGDNNWNRIFRLAPSVLYQIPEVIQNRMTSELIANYTEYDFAPVTGEVRGRSFRELRLKDSLVIFFGRRIGLRAHGEIRIAERGSFSWEQFAESLLERSRTELLELELFRGRDTADLVGVGGKLARVRSFQVDPRGSLFPFSDRTSIGPTVRLLLPVGTSTRLIASGWWEHQFDESELIDRVAWVFLRLEVGM